MVCCLCFTAGLYHFLNIFEATLSISSSDALPTNFNLSIKSSAKFFVSLALEVLPMYISLLTKDDNSDILASGKSIEEVEQKLKKQKIKGATLTFLTPPDKYISPLCQF